jgi:hypothetical protein
MRGARLRAGWGGIAALAALGCGGGAATSKTPVADPAPEAPVAEDEDEPQGGEDLEVVSTRGKLDPDQIEEALAPHAEALQGCYLDQVGKRRWLGGKVELKWDLAADGTLTAVRLAWSDLGAWPIEQCLLGVARGIAFPAPRGGPADFTIPLEFSARGSAGWWDADRGDAAVAKHLGTLERCDAGGTPTENVTITLYVGTRGQVQSAGFSSPRRVDEAWAACAHDLVLGWGLPDPRGQVAKLAFVFRPLEGDEAESDGDDDY